MSSDLIGFQITVTLVRNHPCKGCGKTHEVYRAGMVGTENTQDGHTPAAAVAHFLLHFYGNKGMMQMLRSIAMCKDWGIAVGCDETSDDDGDMPGIMMGSVPFIERVVNGLDDDLFDADPGEDEAEAKEIVN